MHTVSLNIECKNWFDCRFWGSAPGDIHLCTLCTRPHIAFRTQHTELSHLSLAKRARLDSFCLRWLIIEIPFIRRIWMHFFFSRFVYLSCLWLSLFRILDFIARVEWVFFIFCWLWAPHFFHGRVARVNNTHYHPGRARSHRCARCSAVDSVNKQTNRKNDAFFPVLYGKTKKPTPIRFAKNKWLK